MPEQEHQEETNTGKVPSRAWVYAIVTFSIVHAIGNVFIGFQFPGFRSNSITGIILDVLVIIGLLVWNARHPAVAYQLSSAAKANVKTIHRLLIVVLIFFVLMFGSLILSIQ